MSEFAVAIARLEQAVARLEAASTPTMRGPPEADVAKLVETIADRIDAAVARIDRLLEEEAENGPGRS